MKDTNLPERGQASILHSSITVLNDVVSDETVHTKVYNDKKIAPDAAHTETSLMGKGKTQFFIYFGVNSSISLLLTF